MPFVGGGETAGDWLAEPALAVAGKGIVGRVSPTGGDNAEQAQGREGRAEEGENPQDCIGAQQYLSALHEDDGTDTARGDSVFCCKRGACGGLACGEAEDFTLVKAQQKIYPAATDAAFSIKDDDRMFRHCLYCGRGPVYRPLDAARTTCVPAESRMVILPPSSFTSPTRRRFGGTVA